MFEPLRLSKGTTFWRHLFPLPPVPIDQYNNGAPRHHNSFSLSFYPRALHNKVAGISQPWRVSSITWHRAKERGWRDGSASKLWGAREPQPKKSHGLPICQQSQLTSVRDRGSRRSFMHRKKKTRGLYHDGGRDPIFFVRWKLCIQVSPIGPSISGGVSQIEIWHLEPRRRCSLALIWTIASDKLFVSSLSPGEASDNV